MTEYKHCIIVARIRTPSHGKLVAGISRAVEWAEEDRAVDVALTGVSSGTVTALGIRPASSNQLDAIMMETVAGVDAQVAFSPTIPIILISLHTIP